MSRYRNVCFTINNYTDEDLKVLHEMPFTYLVYGREIGQNETPHLQGYVELPKQVRLNTLKKSLPRAHIEKRYGTAQQASDYCKKDGDYYEEGTMSRQGRRTDIHEFVSSIKSGKSTIEVIEDHPVQFVKYTKAYDRIRMEYARQDKAFAPVEVYVYYGKAGQGKTRSVYDKEPDVYMVPTNDAKWFDGYTGQEAIIFDDYYGEAPYAYFLRLLDGYKFQLPIKGGFTWKQWKRVYITTNHHPSIWYADQGMTPALERRITQIKDFT